jgi:hypothetical protein
LYRPTACLLSGAPILPCYDSTSKNASSYLPMSDLFDGLMSLQDVQGLIDGGVSESQTLVDRTR